MSTPLTLDELRLVVNSLATAREGGMQMNGEDTFNAVMEKINAAIAQQQMGGRPPSNQSLPRFVSARQTPLPTLDRSNSMSPLNAVVHAENQLRTAKKKLADYGNSSEMLHNENMDLLRQMQQYADKFTMISTQAEDAISLVEVCVNEWKTAIEMLKKLNKSVFHMNSQVHLLARSAGLRTSPEPMDLSAPCHQNAINTSTFELINNAVHEAKARMENEAKRNRFVKSMYTLTIPNMTTETSDVKEILKKMINEHKNMVQSIDEIVEQMDEIN